MPAIPGDAWWSPADDEWVHGARDAESRLTGLVRYWNKDRVFISDCEHRAGKPHGRARRYYADGSLEQDCHYEEGVITGLRRVFRPATESVETIASLVRLHGNVVVFECHYEGGDLIGTTARNEEGQEIGAHSGELVPQRPPGVPKTASHSPQGWLFMRRQGEDGDKILETRVFYGDGHIKTEDLSDGTHRSFHPGGVLAREGQRTENERRSAGWWRYGDTGGVVRRESRFEFGVERERRWHRPATESGGGHVLAEGPVRVVGGNALESGEWRFTGSGAVTTLHFGEPEDAETLLHDARLADNATDATLEAALHDTPQNTGPAARIARMRLAGREGDASLLSGVILSGTPWLRIDASGDLLDKDGLADLMNVFFFRPPLESFARLSACLFHRDRPRVALELVDAALCLPDEGAEEHARAVLRTRRVSYLRALGEFELANTELREIHGGRSFDAEAAMLLRVRSEPEMDDLRLDFAALVAEAEPDHAALIRIDCGGDDAQARRALVERITQSLPATLAGDTDVLERGFFALDEFSDLQGADFLAHHEDLFRWAPCTTRLDLWFASDQVAELAVLPSLRRYTTLNFWDTLMFDGRAAQLAASPHLAQLEALGLYDSSLWDEELGAILRSTSYPALRSLDISNQREGQHYTFEGFKLLAESAFARTLEVLKMNRRYFSEDITPVLEALPRLRHLEIEGLDLGDAGLSALVSLQRDWSVLRLDRCGIGAEGMCALSEGNMKSLRFLDVGGNKLGEAGLSRLLRAPLTNLKSLRVKGRECGVDEAFGRRMIDAPMASSLEDLDLTLGRLGPSGAVALAQAPLRALRSLKLSYGAIGDEGAKAIASSSSLGELRYLDLGNCDVSDEGGHALAVSPHLEHLQCLELGGAKLSEGVQKALTERFGPRVYFEYPWSR